jgi:sugar lactone lactonase YvrE
MQSEISMFMSFRLKSLPAKVVFSLGVFAAPMLIEREVAAQMPAVVAYGARAAFQTITNPGKITRDAAGDIFVVSGGSIYEIPVNGPLQVVIPSTDPAVASINTFASDPAGDLYVVRSADTVTEVTRNANGTYNLGSSNETTVSMGGLISAADGYYYSASDIAVDALGNVYLIVNTNPPSGGTTNGGGIYMAGPSAPGGKFLLGSFTTQASPLPASITLDSAADVFYADGSYVWELTASTIASGSPVAAKIGSSTMTTPKYVFLDPAGNVYVANGSSADYVIVNNGGFSTSSPTYTLPGTIVGHNAYSYGVVDNQGNLILDYSGSLEFYGGGKVYIDSSTNNYATTTAVGGTGSSTTNNSGASIGLLFTATETLNATTPVVVNAGGSFYGAAGTASNTYNSASNTTCAGGQTYTAGQSCLIEIGYKAYQPGIFASGVNIYGGASSSATNLLASVTAFGIATGPAVAVDAGAKVAVGTGYTMPAGVAVDNTGAIYVADSTGNAVYKFAAGSTSASSASATYGTGLSAPSGVAIDQSGNLYIADTGNNRVVYFVNNAGTFSAQKVLSTGGYTLSSPRGVAVDGSGNLYIADTGNARVLVTIAPTAAAVGAVATVGSGFSSPYAIAIDKLNNVYIADKGANAIYEVPGGYALTTSGTANVGSGTQITVGSGFSGPTGVAVDASGTVYVADGGNSKIWKVPFVSGSYGTPTALFSEPSGGLARPFGIALDLTGDLYFTDADLPDVYFVQRSVAPAGTASTLAFGSVAAGATSTLTATLSNVGYSTAMTESLSTSPAAPFSLSNNGCSASSPLAAGASCGVAVTFTGPSTTDTNQAGSIVFTTNSLNATTSPTTTVTLSGESTGAVSAVTLTGNTTIMYGETETYTVVAKDAAGNPSSSASGSYTVTITGTATSSAPVTLSGGTGTFFLPSLNVGAYSLAISVGGVAATPLSVTISKATLTISPTSVSRIFDTANPSFSLTYTGLGNGDTSSVISGTPTIATSATRISPAGTYAITVTGTFSAANYTIVLANGTLTVTGSAPQVILFDALPGFTGGSTVTLVGISTSGLPLSYSTTAGSISGNVLTVPATGTAVTITATQAGNASYAAATSVSRTFTAQ